MLLLLLPRPWAGAVDTARSAQPRAAPAQARGEEQSWAGFVERFGLGGTIKIIPFQPSCHRQGHHEQDCSTLTGSGAVWAQEGEPEGTHA